MATLVFDIATVGGVWEELSPISQEYLNKWTGETEAGERLGLSPLTGSICALGVYDLERKQSSIYVVAEEEDTPLYRARTERELLEDFWEGARSYDVFVSWGGRRFDIPFLLMRSLNAKVRPTVDLPRNRYLEKQTLPHHVDLYDQFSRNGDTRFPLSLHLMCEASGIETPEGKGVRGGDISELWRAEQFADLAAYTQRNVTATAGLYERWLHTLAPPQFINTLQQ